MVENSLEAFGYKLDPTTKEIYEKYRKSHNAGVFSAYTPAITYFLVPLLAPVVGAIIGAFLYRKLIGRHLPCECGIDE